MMLICSFFIVLIFIVKMNANESLPPEMFVVTWSSICKMPTACQSYALIISLSFISSISRACAPLAAWVKANVAYSAVLLKIEPLTNELNGLMSKLEKFQMRVHQCEEQLNELEIATEALNKDF